MTVKSSKRELSFQTELQSLKVQLKEKDKHIDRLLKESSAQKQLLIPMVTVIQTTKVTLDVHTLPNLLQSLEPESIQIVEENTDKPPESKKNSSSIESWKRARHFLGLQSKKEKN